MGNAVMRYQTKPEAADQNEQLVAKVFAELAEKKPAGLRYASFRLADGVTFVHIVSTEGDGDPLSDIAAFKEFRRNFNDRVVGEPERSSGELVGSYEFLTH
ncbi:hypothetical protein [Amycolatopsis sp. cmx-11-12]|uniref:hypothetical protein n=1 Tax=Amycolatopsis sp. cmx-11-12 TaxID=2785795 RepID=UPI0039186474